MAGHVRNPMWVSPTFLASFLPCIHMLWNVTKSWKRFCQTLMPSALCRANGPNCDISSLHRQTKLQLMYINVHNIRIIHITVNILIKMTNLEFTKSFTVKENNPWSYRLVWSSRSALGTCGNYGPSPLIPRDLCSTEGL